MKTDQELDRRLNLLPEAAAQELRDVVFTPEAGEQVRQRLGQGADRKSRRRWLPAVIGGAAAAAVAAAVLLYPPSLSVKAENLMKGIQPAAAAGEPLSADFKAAVADFGLRFSAVQRGEGNTLVSPLSLYLTLAMLGNGADGQTKAEFDALLGTAAEERNPQCRTLLDRLGRETEQGRVSLAHSIWFDQSLSVNPAFLQTNADFFSAAAYRGDFDSPDTVRDINRWGKYHTDGLIPRMIDTLRGNDLPGEQTVMAVIGAVLFDQKWETPYKKADILKDQPFYTPKGEVRADYLCSKETTLIEGNGFTGFTKAYKGQDYQFVGLLPDEGTSPEALLRALDGDAWLTLLQGTGGAVTAYIPKFSFDARLELQEPLSAMGLVTAFDPDRADFRSLANVGVPLWIGDAFQQTRVELDENGTKAASITFFGMKCGNSAPPEKEVRLDRPFVYAIVHADSGLPLFIGVLRNPAA